MRELTQSAALPYVILQDGVEVCLITSRDSGRWIIPKGWPKSRRTLYQLAEREAREEAGLKGDISHEPIGTFTYRKKLHILAYVTCRVSVFPMLVEKQKLSWRESSERQLSWFSCADAARRVAEPDLSAIILSLPDWIARRTAA